MPQDKRNNTPIRLVRSRKESIMNTPEFQQHPDFDKQSPADFDYNDDEILEVIESELDLDNAVDELYNRG